MHAALTLGTALTAIALAVAGCSNSTTSSSGGSSSSAASASATTSSSSASASTQHNQADVTFAQNMIPHHRQAVEMSDMLLAKQGIDPHVVELANQIKAAQGPEIQTMQGWLSAWGAPAPSSSGAPMPGMDMPGMDHSTMAAMPGMMSDQDMAALQNAQGIAASKTFLTKMIAHHQGAIAMANTEINTGQNPDAIALAKSIATTQQQEITTMQNILSSL
ncbi:DUF305 domain-containing protein [Mycolicibacterium grossiae]|uniref:DUF305 domain-containing protein n=2 Tax=Mycolicibacterium grossiae TaxID=1552759 RepID=A0A1E8PZA7_9MYCO|nr:DUF305 domain-containing protein [Mycolicibacterium grossiae]OFJ51180.1 DUF305 domain-containing protein [Mycolicibacterium grossiae]